MLIDFYDNQMNKKVDQTASCDDKTVQLTHSFPLLSYKRLKGHMMGSVTLPLSDWWSQYLIGQKNWWTTTPRNSFQQVEIKTGTQVLSAGCKQLKSDHQFLLLKHLL